MTRFWKSVLDHYEKMRKVILAGYAGVDSKGTIVDRRDYPNALPIKKNTYLGIPKPKSVKKRKGRK